jgi:hypothetical protein
MAPALTWALALARAGIGLGVGWLLPTILRYTTFESPAGTVQVLPAVTSGGAMASWEPCTS